MLGEQRRRSDSVSDKCGQMVTVTAKGCGNHRCAWQSLSNHCRFSLAEEQLPERRAQVSSVSVLSPGERAAPSPPPVLSLLLLLVRFPLRLREGAASSRSHSQSAERALNWVCGAAVPVFLLLHPSNKRTGCKRRGHSRVRPCIDELCIRSFLIRPRSV